LASIIFPIFVFASLYAGPLFSWVFNNKYNDAVAFFLIYAWVIPVRIANYTAILQQKGKANLITIGSISALIVKLGLMFFLYPFLQTKGIAIACVLGTFYQNIFYLYHTARALDIPFNAVLPFIHLLVILVIAITINVALYLCLRNIDMKFQVVFGCIATAFSSILIFSLYSRNRIRALSTKTSIPPDKTVLS
jgi:O-antigen/teichoic acid export membrane protein